MKRLFAVLSVAGILVLSVTGALAVIPHGHGDDLDHAKNPHCVVHQAGALMLAGSVTVFIFSFVLLLVRQAASRAKLVCPSTARPSFFLRAPPAQLS